MLEYSLDGDKTGTQARDEVEGYTWERVALAEKRDWTQDNLEKVESTLRNFSLLATKSIRGARRELS